MRGLRNKNYILPLDILFYPYYYQTSLLGDIMASKFDEVTAAVAEARETIAAADRLYIRMGSMLRGNLRKCSDWDLVALKRELQDFDAHKKTWKTK